MSEYDDKDSIFNCDEETLDNEGYFIKKDWDEWLSEWRKHHYRNKIMLYINEREQKGEDVVIDEQVIKDHQNYVSIDASLSSVYLNRESLRRTCLNIARTMRKTLGKNKQDLYDFKHDKELTGLKYTSIRTKVNFIQITVIIVSTIITFLETMKDKFSLTNNISMTIAPILLSTYIGLALAISRFCKLDDHKEELCKLDEAQSFVISGLRHRARMIQSMMPLYCDQDIDTRRRDIESGNEIEEINAEKLKAMLDYFDIIEKIIEDQSKDGLEETMSNCKQKFDLVMNLTEKVYYKNILLNISIDEDIVDGNKRILHDDSSKKVLTLKEYEIKKEQCCMWKYLCCFCNDCIYHYIDKKHALKLINDRRKEKEEDKKANREEMIKSQQALKRYDTYREMNGINRYDDLNEDKISKQLSIISSVSENEQTFDRAFTAYNRCNSIIEKNKGIKENTIISEKGKNNDTPSSNV